MRVSLPCVGVGRRREVGRAPPSPPKLRITCTHHATDMAKTILDSKTQGTSTEHSKHSSAHANALLRSLACKHCIGTARDEKGREKGTGIKSSACHSIQVAPHPLAVVIVGHIRVVLPHCNAARLSHIVECWLVITTTFGQHQVKQVLCELAACSQKPSVC